jgi:50S ribosomal protein L16 3-hydroxylase
MLRDWLAPVTVEAFIESCLRRVPYARPSAATNALPLLDWDVLSAVLEARPSPDVLVATRGRLVDIPAPKSLSAVRELMHRGLGVVVRKAELHDRNLAELARAFAGDLHGEVHVQLYATPANTQTFGWHFDFEDVFIAQTVGTKDYYFRDNTVARHVVPGPHPDFGAISRETSPLLSSTLIPGDWLYIPSRWWHLVRSLEDALSISIGVVPLAGRYGMAGE